MLPIPAGCGIIYWVFDMGVNGIDGDTDQRLQAESCRLLKPAKSNNNCGLRIRYSFPQLGEDV